MPDMFDYLSWRGDIPFSQVPPGPVDALIFTTLSYIEFDGIAPETPYQRVTMADAAAALLQNPLAPKKVRLEKDLELLAVAASCPRFQNVGLGFYRDVFAAAENTQFAAMTFYLDDGSAFLAFRGTDKTLVGWREDFNMTFLESIPAQRLAKEYVLEFAAASGAPMHLGGHSKGGNLAIYAAAKVPPAIQNRIVRVYNQDGPGFTEKILSEAGYRRMVPKIRTYVPQSSVFGLLLDREEPHTIIRSRQIGIMQHEPYSWEVMGSGFMEEEKLTADSRFLDRTFKTWLAGMTTEERYQFFDTVFDLLMTEEACRPLDIFKPQNLKAYFLSLTSDGKARKIITSELENLIQSAKAVQLVDEELRKENK